MRRSVVGGLIVALVIPWGPGANAGEPEQTVTGTVIMPTPHPQAPDDCFAGYQRRFAFFTQEAVNGVFGYHFDVDEDTWGGKFVLTPADDTHDLDITFYQSFDTDPTDPLGGPVSHNIGHRSPGGEKGEVPETMTKAIVCLWAGQSHQGVNSTFTYEAYKPVRKKKKR